MFTTQLYFLAWTFLSQRTRTLADIFVVLFRPLSPSTLDQNYKEESSFVTAPSVPQTPAAAPPAPDPEPEPEPVKPEPVVEPPHPPPAEPAPAVEEEEEEGKQEDPDWSGLA
jgi:colicin import membrane protein